MSTLELDILKRITRLRNTPDWINRYKNAPEPQVLWINKELTRVVLTEIAGEYEKEGHHLAIDRHWFGA